jgi:hypothetical protein
MNKDKNNCYCCYTLLTTICCDPLLLFHDDAGADMYLQMACSYCYCLLIYVITIMLHLLKVNNVSVTLHVEDYREGGPLA